MDALSSLHCELKIMNAKNIQLTNSSGYLFVRCYLSAGNNKRVRVDSREVSSNGYICWNESFSLDCVGTKQSMDMIVHGTIVLELRWRSNSFALFGRSQLVGRGEVSWRGAFESPSMEIERCVMMEMKKKGVKAPSVRVAMKIVVLSRGGLVARKMNKWDESCECCHGDCCNNTYVDTEFFLIGGALDAF
ncbi:hypothetical protein L1987_68636 [Smallanthus sonchifolius]|uniref:Uncharacterized protein n=1 Tax=Smallanthus sonchifolius TaxID=185202 RepID=A0ACB9B918_9ASTR|nr:hypothetical protein L1987_68636 [Smallanthus sonchifolius]